MNCGKQLFDEAHTNDEAWINCWKQVFDIAHVQWWIVDYLWGDQLFDGAHTNDEEWINCEKQMFDGAHANDEWINCGNVSDVWRGTYQCWRVD